MYKYQLLGSESWHIARKAPRVRRSLLLAEIQGRVPDFLLIGGFDELRLVKEPAKEASSKRKPEGLHHQAVIHLPSWVAVFSNLKLFKAVAQYTFETAGEHP